MAEHDRPLLHCFDGVATVWRPVHRGSGSSDAPVAGRSGETIARSDEARAERAAALASEGSAIARDAGSPLSHGPSPATTRPPRSPHSRERSRPARAWPAAARRLPTIPAGAVGDCANDARGQDCPVLVTHGDQTDAPAGAPILLAFDGSDAARHAITTSAPLLGGGTALVVHAWLAPSHVLLWNPLVKSPGPLTEPAAMLDEASAEAAHRLASEGGDHARAAGYDPEPVAVPIAHSTWRTILRAARDRHARAIVVGSHGWSPLDAALGTVANRTTTHADRPVLMVPREETAHDRAP